MFGIPGIFGGINVFVVRRASSAEQIAERILYPAPPAPPNCLCSIIEPKKEDEK
jgi:hypothetical protein